MLRVTKNGTCHPKHLEFVYFCITVLLTKENYVSEMSKTIPNDFKIYFSPVSANNKFIYT